MKNTSVLLICFLIISCRNKIDATSKKATNTNKSITKNLFKKNAVDTLLNTKKYLIIGPKKTIIKIASNLDTLAGFKEIVSYKNDIIMAKGSSYDDLKIYRKFNPTKSFKDFEVNLYKGKLASPNFKTNLDAKRFITRITNECKKGVNFAGHYTLVSWGCGTACQSNVLVDRKTGKISKSFITSFGVDYDKTSTLLIKNVGAVDYKTNLIEVCGYCEVSLEIWDGVKFTTI